jgi:hypothetical protein
MVQASSHGEGKRNKKIRSGKLPRGNFPRLERGLENERRDLSMKRLLHGRTTPRAVNSEKIKNKPGGRPARLEKKHGANPKNRRPILSHRPLLVQGANLKNHGYLIGEEKSKKYVEAKSLPFLRQQCLRSKHWQPLLV